MRMFGGLRGVGVAAGVAVSLTMCTVSGAVASGLKICVPEKEGAAIVTQKAGICKAKYTATSLLPETEQQKLQAILPHINSVSSGVGGQPTIEFSGVNVQLVNGEGKTASVNGAGNLVIGYDENPGSREQTGSHNLVLGQSQLFTSYGGIIGGFGNASRAPYASVIGGTGSEASGELSTVSSGGYGNVASGSHSTISGGYKGTASGPYSSVSGGFENTASEFYATVSGGRLNAASGFASAIFGGKELKAKNEYEAIP
jgi:hypothetical protein